MVTYSTKWRDDGGVVSRLLSCRVLPLLIILIMTLERLTTHSDCYYYAQSKNLLGTMIAKESENLRGTTATTTTTKATATQKEDEEWPPGGVEWDTGQEAVERARNKLPPRENESTSNHPQPFLKSQTTFKESALFHEWLDGLKGIEIGSSAHNGFGLDTLNVDFSSEFTEFKNSEVANTGVYRRVDVVSAGNKLPFGANSLDFVVSSHAVEHLYDPIGFVCEAARIVKPGGFVASILPLHGAHPPDKDRDRTKLSELIERHRNPIDPSKDDHRHWQVWMVEDMIEMYRHMNMVVVAAQAVDDKVGNGFSVIARVPKNKFDINCS